VGNGACRVRRIGETRSPYAATDTRESPSTPPTPPRTVCGQPQQRLITAASSCDHLIQCEFDEEATRFLHRRR
jgi:hypothetical protein